MMGNDGWTVNSSFKWLSQWGEADSYFLVNADTSYRLKGFDDARLFFRIENLLGEDIRLPEIGRENPVVPTIPESEKRKIYLGISINY